MTIMVIQCGCLNMMWAEDGKLHSQLEWPNATLAQHFWVRVKYESSVCQVDLRYRSDATSHSLKIFISTRARITLDLRRVFKPATKK